MPRDSSRREFLQTASAAAAATAAGSSACGSVGRKPAATGGLSYAALGVRPIINGMGTVTILGGSIMPPEVTSAMVEASKDFVPLIELQQKAGEYLARRIGVPAAMVTCGAASAITVGTAAAITAGDPEKLARLPDTSGMKNEIIQQKAHDTGYQAQMLVVGTKIVWVESRADFEKAVNERTAMAFFLNKADPDGQLKRAEWIELAKAHGVPTMNDAAADVPPPERLHSYVEEGFDMVIFSGGKGLLGPQCTGLLLGRPDLIAAGQKAISPHGGIGRGMKVGKEEIMGILAAVETYASRDHDADQKEWRGFMERISKDLKGVPTVETEVYIPGPGGHPVPYLRVAWNEAKIPLSYQECARQLREGEPSIEVNAQNGDAVRLASYNLFPGEDRIVGWRLREVLLEAVQNS